jgi:hypothetical protein
MIWSCNCQRLISVRVLLQIKRGSPLLPGNRTPMWPNRPRYLIWPRCTIRGSALIIEILGITSLCIASSMQFHQRLVVLSCSSPKSLTRNGTGKGSSPSLSVFDILGRGVSLLINDRRDAGVHEVNFMAQISRVACTSADFRREISSRPASSSFSVNMETAGCSGGGLHVGCLFLLIQGHCTVFVPLGV